MNDAGLEILIFFTSRSQQSKSTGRVVELSRQICWPFEYAGRGTRVGCRLGPGLLPALCCRCVPGRLAEASSPTETPGFRCHLPSPLSYAPMPPGLDPECPLLSLPPLPVPLASPTESTPLVRVPRQRPLGTALTTRCVPLREMRMTSAPLGSLGLAGTSFNLDPATHGVFTMSVTKSHQKWVPATGE